MIDLQYILRTVVYVQPFLWLYLLDKDIKVNNIFIKVLFPVSLVSIYIILNVTGFYFSQYTNSLLCFYILLMLNAFVILSLNYGFYDSVCLTFIIVFINSYYWEFMLHLNVILFYGFSFNQFIQSFHLIPSYMLYKKLDLINRKMFFKLVVLGLIISNLNLLVINFMPLIRSTFRNNITRFLCLNILLYAVSKYTKIIKKEGDIKLPFLDNKPN